MKITMIMVVTADGKIARNSNQTSLDWTSKEDIKFFVQKTKEVGVVIMGRRTFDTIGRPLKGRRIIVMCAPGESLPEKMSDATVDAHGMPTGGTVEFTSMQPPELINRLDKEGIQNAVLAGGATINGLFLSARLINEIFLTIEPIIFGQGLGIFEGPGAKEFVEACAAGTADGAEPVAGLKLELVKTTHLSNNVINVHYRVL